MIDVREITDLHETTVALWHRRKSPILTSGFLHVVCQQHTFNYLLWHEEDIARSPNVGDERIAEVKRAIDGYNQKRNDAIEQLDAYLLRELDATQESCPQPMPGRTPKRPAARSTGCRSCRCAAITCRSRPTAPTPAEEHRAKARERLEILAEQHRDLSTGCRTAGRHLRRPQATEGLLPIQDVQRPDDESVSVSSGQGLGRRGPSGSRRRQARVIAGNAAAMKPARDCVRWGKMRMPRTLPRRERNPATPSGERESRGRESHRTRRHVIDRDGFHRLAVRRGGVRDWSR